MSNADWKKLNEIFAVAIEMDADAQNEFLRQIADESLRREAEAILNASRCAADRNFLAADAFAAAAKILAENDKENAPAPQQIGKYKILREIGRGGMGAIYLAERADFHQRVALKIIKRGMDTDAIVSRFEREREVLAALNHPFIARLLDGSATDDGLPFLVMEYVEGTPLSEYCDRNSLNIEERLALFQKVCAAVAFAHRNLIVHRDLKPSNILVNKDGEPKLLDFGIAKLLTPEKSEQTTETGFRLLTPEYASPEQLRGERVTTASDVYSLGVLLYELLTGQRPHKFTGRNAAEIIRAVCETEPTKPSEAVTRENAVAEKETKDQKITTRQLKGDLDNIILKALRKEAAGRYSSVEQFGEDIARYLNGLPVIARPATFGYKAAKFVERNRTAVALASFAVIALLAGLSIAVWQAVVARQERARAEQRFNEVRRLANTLVAGWDKDIPESLVSNQVRGRIADISTEYLDNLARETNDAALLKELARAYVTVGHQYSQQFVQVEKARSSLRKAEAIARRLVRDAPDETEAKQLLAQCLHQYDEYFGERDRVESLKNRLEIVRLNEEILAANPDDQKAMFDLGGAYALNGLVLKFVGRHEESLDYYARAAAIGKRRVEILERAAAVMPDDRAKLANAYISLAVVQAGELKDFESAVKSARRGAEIADALYAENPENQTVVFAAGTAYFELGAILKKSGAAQGSLETFRKSLDFARIHLARWPGSGYFKRKEYDSLMEIAEALHEAGEPDAALDALRQSFELRRKLTESQKEALRNYGGHAYLFNAGGKLLLRMNRFDEALDAFREAENAHLKILEAEPNQILNRRNLAVLYLTLGDFQAGAGVCNFQQAKNFDALSESYRYCPPESNNIAANRQGLRQAREFYQKAVRLLTAFETQSVAQFDDRENLRFGKEKVAFCEKELNR